MEIEEAERFKKTWNDLKQKESKNKTAKDKNLQVIENIVAEHDSPNTELLTKLLDEGIKLLAQNEEKESFRMLERAALLSPKNVSLLVFIGKTFFFADKFADAKKHLETAHLLAPDNFDILLLLGAIYADEAETEKARRFLSILAGNEKTSRVVNFIWGILAAFEENWTESIAAFKLALDNSEIPELQYLIGCDYFQMTDENSARRHLEQAVAADKKYSDAWFMQAVIYRSQMDEEREKNALQNAADKPEVGSQCSEMLRKNKLDLAVALPFQHFKKANKHLLTGGALRLMRFFKSEIGRVIE